MQKLTFVIGANAAGKTYFIEHHLANEKAVALTTKGCQATSKIVANTSLAANVPAGPAIMRASGSFFNTVKIRPATIRYTIAIMTLYIV